MKLSRREFAVGAAALALGGWSHGISNGPLNWSPTDVALTIAVNSSISTLNHDTGGGWVFGRSDRSQSNGLRYIEFLVLVAGDTANFMRIGIGNGVTGLGVSSGLDTNSISYGSQGNVLYNSGFLSSPPASFTAGDTLGMLVDFNVSTVKFNKNGGTFSPAYDISSIGSEIFLNVCFNSASILPSVQLIANPKYPFPGGSQPWINSPVFANATLNIVNDGDSISLTSAATSIYLPQLANLIVANGKGIPYWTRCGINGASWNYAWNGTIYPYTITQDAPLRVDVAQRNGITNWLIPFAGTNGILLAGHSAATEYSDFQTYIAARISAGWTAANIVVCTCLPRTGLNETTRGTYNTDLVNGAVTYGYKLARLDQDPTIGQAGDNLNTTYYSDGTHPTAAGHAIIASIIYAVMFQ